MITKDLPTLKIHKLSQEQYDRAATEGNIDEDALYLTPDAGGGIIDVLELPTEGIQKGAFYRVPTAAMYDGIYVRANINVHIVDSLPEAGEPYAFYDPDLDDNRFNLYYDLLNDSLHAYSTEETNSYYSFYDTVGWNGGNVIIDYVIGCEFVGVTYDKNDIVDDCNLRLLIEYRLYHYNNCWVENTPVGFNGSGIYSTVFNSFANTASGQFSHAEGGNTTASSWCSHAEGSNTTASGECSHTEGNITTASGDDSHAEGFDTTASGDYSHAEGFETTASGHASHAEGGGGYCEYIPISGKAGSTTYSYFSETEFEIRPGILVICNGTTAIIEDVDTSNKTITVSQSLSEQDLDGEVVKVQFNGFASGEYSHAEGGNTTASGECSHAEGCETTSSGDFSHAEGCQTTGSAAHSHAEGCQTTASGWASHAEGSYTTASEYASHAEGEDTIASGEFSHAEGEDTIASGSNSHAEGFYTKASRRSQHAQGEYNIEDTEGEDEFSRGKYAHIVGNGNYTKRSNAHTLDWDGNGWFQGTVKIGGTSQDDPNAKELATKEYITTAIEQAIGSAIGGSY